MRALRGRSPVREEGEPEPLVPVRRGTPPLSFVYQPIIDLRDGRAVGMEGLTRVRSNPEGGAEALFVDAAERGALLELELHAMEELLLGAAAMPDDLYLSVNASPSTITDPAFGAALAAFPPERLVVEVTERETIDDFGAVREAMAPHRERGVRLAVDDVGAGVASFHHLIELRADIIKLDAALTDAIHTDLGQRAMARAITSFAAETGAVVVAEGVQSVSCAVELALLGVAQGQGFALGRPAPAPWQEATPLPS